MLGLPFDQVSYHVRVLGAIGELRLVGTERRGGGPNSSTPTGETDGGSRGGRAWARKTPAVIRRAPSCARG